VFAKGDDDSIIRESESTICSSDRLEVLHAWAESAATAASIAEHVLQIIDVTAEFRRMAVHHRPQKKQ